MARTITIVIAVLAALLLAWQLLAPPAGAQGMEPRCRCNGVTCWFLPALDMYGVGWQVVLYGASIPTRYISREPGSLVGTWVCQ